MPTSSAIAPPVTGRPGWSTDVMMREGAVVGPLGVPVIDVEVAVPGAVVVVDDELVVVVLLSGVVVVVDVGSWGKRSGATVEVVSAGTVVVVLGARVGMVVVD